VRYWALSAVLWGHGTTANCTTATADNTMCTGSWLKLAKDWQSSLTVSLLGNMELQSFLTFVTEWKRVLQIMARSLHS
jgi:hypothetical protein